MALPQPEYWMPNADITVNERNLTLERIQMWGYEEGNEDGICLFCRDISGNQYEAEISHFSDCLSRHFICTFLIERYEQSIKDIFNAELEINEVAVSIFTHEVVRPGFADMRWRAVED